MDFLALKSDINYSIDRVKKLKNPSGKSLTNTNVLIREFFSNLTSEGTDLTDEEAREISSLLEELDRKGEEIAKQLDISFTPNKVIIKSSRKKNMVRFVCAQAAKFKEPTAAESAAVEVPIEAAKPTKAALTGTGPIQQEINIAGVAQRFNVLFVHTETTDTSAVSLVEASESPLAVDTGVFMKSAINMLLRPTISTSTITEHPKAEVKNSDMFRQLGIILVDGEIEAAGTQDLFTVAKSTREREVSGLGTKTSIEEAITKKTARYNEIIVKAPAVGGVILDKDVYTPKDVTPAAITDVTDILKFAIVTGVPSYFRENGQFFRVEFDRKQLEALIAITEEDPSFMTGNGLKTWLSDHPRFFDNRPEMRDRTGALEKVFEYAKKDADFMVTGEKRFIDALTGIITEKAKVDVAEILAVKRELSQSAFDELRRRVDEEAPFKPRLLGDSGKRDATDVTYALLGADIGYTLLSGKLPLLDKGARWQATFHGNAYNALGSIGLVENIDYYRIGVVNDLYETASRFAPGREAVEDFLDIAKVHLDDNSLDDMEKRAISFMLYGFGELMATGKEESIRDAAFRLASRFLSYEEYKSLLDKRLMLKPSGESAPDGSVAPIPVARFRIALNELVGSS